jgi:glucosamine-6-phosphate deaminase
VRYHFLDGESDPQMVADDIGRKLAASPIDVAFVGIGENGHLAFNDPPADFVTKQPYIIVALDEACRRQQVGEGWFPSIDAVPSHAISMSVHQILESNEIICIVPDARKATAVRVCVEGAVSPMAPASILQRHPNTTLYLDRASASLLS